MKEEFSLFPYELEDVFSIQEVKQNAGWGIQAFEIPKAWQKTRGEGVKIAVLDSGCDLDHPDLINNILPGINLVDKNKDPWDENKHGTHVCGIIAAENNDIGVVGVAPAAKIVPIKVLDKYGNGNAKAIYEGIKWAVDVAKVDFICMSLGSPGPVDSIHEAIKYALSKKVISFVAAGNSGKTQKVFYPAEYPESIAIGSIDENFERSNFSNTGKNLDFLAPGSRILSTVPDNWYAIMSGTSMATPFVVGVAALYLSYVRNNNKNIKLDSNLDYVRIFKEHTISSKVDSKCFYKGFGILDPKKLFENLKSFIFDLLF